ncbi:MAG: alpha/beta hydrolase, partial [Actinomycetota bacterium]
MTSPKNVDYDEFGLFAENIAEYGIDASSTPIVKRVNVGVADGRNISALVWGDADPQLVFVHGGAQNAHTWDTVALALGVPLVA